MNTHPDYPEQPDGPLDNAIEAELLDQALSANEAPADLEAKVLALTDPRMLSLLDEVLEPEAMTQQQADRLAERIIAATTPGALQARDEAAPAVLAKIGPTPWRYAAAAALLFAAGIGLWWSNQGETAIDDGNHVAVDTTPAEPAWLDSEAYAANTPSFDLATGPVQARIKHVANNIDDVTINRESIWSDMDGYEQFLSDLETADEDTPAT